MCKLLLKWTRPLSAQPVAHSHKIPFVRHWQRCTGLGLLLWLIWPPACGLELREAEWLFQRPQQRYLKPDLENAIKDLPKVVAPTTQLQPPQHLENTVPGHWEAEGKPLGVIEPRAALADTTCCIAHYEQHNFDAALTNFKQTLRLVPRYVGASLVRALTWQAKGEFTQVWQAYNRARQLDAHYGDAANNRDCLYAGQNQFQEALNDFDAALFLSPRTAVMYANRGRTRRSLQDTLGAMTDSTRAIELDAKVAGGT
jgi:tetratricopeptide (TPR) repeat protein